MEAIAKTKYLKGSPRKARLVIDLIRGVNVSRALSILKFTDKRAAQPIAQCLNSAIANATYKAEQDNIAIDPDDLWIKTCFVDIGPTKGRSRMRPAPQGRAYREQRHYCHITIQVTSEEKAKSEEQMRLEALRDERIAARKAENAKKKKAAPKKEAKTKTKKAKAAPIEESSVEETVETPTVENVEAEATAAAETQAEVVEENKAEIDAEISAAHETSTHTTAEENAKKPVDDVMEKTNEDLERQ
ncbi:MAG: 50S ribosomal protein L22 [Pyrinomonadaceae bacterium]